MPFEVLRAASQIEAETRLLNLFSPVAPPDPPGHRQRRDDNLALWRADAVHRANNLAQLSLSLAHVVSDLAPSSIANNIMLPARALSQAYEQLGVDCGNSIPVLCLDMLSNVATRLGMIFGQARGICLSVAGNEMPMLPEIRRAVVLMCSELIINALKYAFPDERRGTILVQLHQDAGMVELVVADDGIGMSATDHSGQGSELLDKLARVAGATIDRSSHPNWTGLWVAVRFPAVSSGHATHTREVG